MLIYILLIVVSLMSYLYFLKEKNLKFVKVSFFLVMILFTVVSAIRYNVGSDYKIIYENYFELLKSGGHYHYEALFLYLNKLIILLNGNAQVLFFICSCFTIPLFFRFISKNVEKKYWFLSVLLFIITTIYFATMNAIRQYIAIAILANSYTYLKENKKIKYALSVVIATLFHTSAIITLLIPIMNFIFKNNRHKKVLKILYILSLFFIVYDISKIINLFEFILPDKYKFYIGSFYATEKNMGAVLKIIIPNILLLICFKYKDKIKEMFSDFDYIFYAWYIYVLISNAFYGINIFIRLGWYFEYFILLIVPMLVSYFNKNNFKLKNKEFSKFSFVISLVVIMFYSALTVYSIFLGGGHGVVPYKTIF